MDFIKDGARRAISIAVLVHNQSKQNLKLLVDITRDEYLSCYLKSRVLNPRPQYVGGHCCRDVRIGAAQRYLLGFFQKFNIDVLQ